MIDLWKRDVEPTCARDAPACERVNAFMDPLREVAPNERVIRYHPPAPRFTAVVITGFR